MGRWPEVPGVCGRDPVAIASCCIALLLAGPACSRSEDPSRGQAVQEPGGARAAKEAVSQPAAVGEQEQQDGYAASAAHNEGDGRMRYGRALVEGTPEVTLSELLAAPQQFAGKNVRISGTVARVCKAMGCWMELRDDAAPDRTLRAPMAGHAFFLPQAAVGSPATIEGPVRVAELSKSQKEHYRAEGMQAVDVAASIDAECVVVGGGR